MSSIPIEDIFWKAGVALTVVLCLRLVLLSLFSEYRALGVFLAFSSVRSIALMTLSRGSEHYGDLYVYSTPLLWFFAILVALEIYSKVLEGYRGLSIFTRRTLVSVLLVSGVGSVLFVALSIGSGMESYPQLRMVLLFEQAVALTLFFFLLLMAAFLLWYPIPLRRNLIVYSFGYSVVLLTFATAVGLRNLRGHSWTRGTNITILGIYAVCLLLWIAFMSIRGESEVRSAAIPRGKSEEKRLLEQLSAMNALLEGGRKS